VLLENSATSSAANSIAIKIAANSSTILFHPTEGSGKKLPEIGST
jgi:hypothetical protein